MTFSKKDCWEKYVYEGTLVEGVDPIVADAWQRCKNYQIDYKKGLGKKVDSEAYERALRDNKELLEIARPIMANLHEIVLGTHFVLVLTDRNGLILESIGDHVVRDAANKLRYNVGALWSEKEVGSNAIGTALHLDKPVQFAGEDHYCVSHHVWTCSATTIHDENGQVIGCIDMSGNRKMANSHTLGIVVSAAYTIERHMALKKSHRLLESTFESTSDGMIIVDEALSVIRFNHHALNILGLREEEIIKRDIRQIFGDLNFNINMEKLKQKGNLYLTDCIAIVEGRRIYCSINLVPIIIDNLTQGFSIAFKETKYLHKTVNKVAGNMATYHFDDIIGESTQISEVIASAKKIAKTRSNVLIEGESGTGKELFAQSIHNYSTRRKGPFVAINCASLPRELIESELFGYEKGAFTGASNDGKIGKFELADGGTIFLDEIGELPIEVQAKLLRVLDNYAIRRIGSNYEKKLDVRVIAATNRNLLEEAEKKNFRHDLYYRLNVFKLELPPLRERSKDIHVCAHYFLHNLINQNHNSVKIYSASFLDALERYRWVGNVRELQNIIERAYYLCDDNVITEAYLPDHIKKIHGEVPYELYETTQQLDIYDIETVERKNIINMLISCNKNVLAAADKLSMSKSTIYRKINKYAIDLSDI